VKKHKLRVARYVLLYHIRANHVPYAWHADADRMLNVCGSLSPLSVPWTKALNGVPFTLVNVRPGVRPAALLNLAQHTWFR
jgi:hypothetical protein